MQVTTSKDTFGDSLGVTAASLNINSYLVTDDFYVMAPRNLQEEVMLGKGWMNKHNLYMLGTPTLVSRSVNHHKTMYPPLIVDPKGTIHENPNSQKPKSFELDDRGSSKDKAIAKSPEA